MADISIQFHSLPEELIPLVRECAIEFGLHVVAISRFPFEAFEIDLNSIDKVLEESRVKRLSFTLESPILAVKSGNEFEDQNPDSLLLSIGTLTEQGLEESWLAARTANPKAIATWKAVATRLRKMTKAGAIAINPSTGARAEIRGHRYTTRALSLDKDGVRMLPAGGSNFYTFSA